MVRFETASDHGGAFARRRLAAETALMPDTTRGFFLKLALGILGLRNKGSRPDVRVQDALHTKRPV